MKVFISSNCLFDYSLEKTLSLYKDSGIDQIELSSYSKKTSSENINEIINHHKVKYLVHNYFPPPPQPFIFNLASTNLKINQQSFQLAQNAILLAAKIKAPIYSFHAGFLQDAKVKMDKETNTFKFDNKNLADKKTALHIFLKNMCQLQKIAKKNKVILLIENNVCPPNLKDKLLFVDHQDFLWLFSQKGIEDVGVLLDTGHLKVSAQTYGFSPQKVIDKLKNKIKALHLHDNNGLADSHQGIKTNSWIVKLIKNLQKYQPILILEARLKNIDEVLQQKKYLESF